MLINFQMKSHYLFALCLSMGILGLGIVFYAIYQWHSDLQVVNEALPAPKKISSTANEMAYLQALPEYHIFGKSLPNLGKVPLSNLQLRVVGIVKLDSAQEKPSKAYISMSGKGGKIYQVGDLVSDGVRVYDITPLAVILENDGHLEKLPLLRKKLHFKKWD